MRILILGAVVACGIITAGCGSRGGDNLPDASVEIDSAQCVGLECSQMQCAGGGTTSISGVVYAPNGTLLLHNVTVYVPNGQVAPIPSGASCDRCGTVLSGDPLIETTTDEAGRFTLTNVPVAPNIPVVIQVGKWRRQITVPNVTACADTPLAASDTRLPRNKTEGDIPLMALSTGGADALECLLRKIGIDDSEFTTAGGSGRVHLFAGRDGTDFFVGGERFAAATTLWESKETLSVYDIVLLSCEGNQFLDSKQEPARTAMGQYADLGGRVFASHWHNAWLEHGPAAWQNAITFTPSLPDLNRIDATVNTNFARGASLASWLVNVGASTVLGTVTIDAAQHTVSAVDETLVDRWIYKDDTANDTPSIQYLSFTTPIDAEEDERCGRVVFSDIHVASGDLSRDGFEFPDDGCTSATSDLSAQEKVLAFMIFDIASCVGPVIE